jgi:hypothetical protein
VIEINEPHAVQSCNGESCTSRISAPRSRKVAIAALMPRWVPSLTLWSVSWKWWITPILSPLIPLPSYAV